MEGLSGGPPCYEWAERTEGPGHTPSLLNKSGRWRARLGGRRQEHRLPVLASALWIPAGTLSGHQVRATQLFLHDLGDARGSQTV